MQFWRVQRRVASFAVAVVVLATATLAGGFSPAVAHEGHGHPARVHEGSCDDLRAAAFTLSGPGADTTPPPDNELIPQGEIVGVMPVPGVVGSVTMIDAAFDDIFEERHAIMVYESDEAMDVAIVCGDIGGQMIGDDLAIGLKELNDSGFAGIALLRGEGDQTRVSLFVSEGLFGDGDGDGHSHSHADDADDHHHADDEGTPAGT